LTLVGRKDDCDLRLNHKSISKQHCVIVRTDGLLLLRDLGSTNGTRVNGQRVRRAALLPNDVLSVASSKFRVQFGPDEAGAPPEAMTQRIEGKDLDRLLKRVAVDADDASGSIPSVDVKTNALPDVYPNDDSEA